MMSTPSHEDLARRSAIASVPLHGGPEALARLVVSIADVTKTFGSGSHHGALEGVTLTSSRASSVRAVRQEHANLVAG
jgi:hypothetical protein